MPEPLATDPYKGVRDFYPSEWARLQSVFGIIRTTLELYGYEEYNASPLERAELYEAKTSEEIVNEQTYTFEDRGGRRVTLRPEMTPTFARMVAGKRRELPFPLRWYSLPNLFRYERPQRGRLREHYQLNVDLAGLSSLHADAEIVRMAHAVLSAFGAKNQDFIIRINSRTLLTKLTEEAGLSSEGARAYIRLLDKKSKLPPEEFRASVSGLTKTDPLSFLEGGSPSVQEAKASIDQFLLLLQEAGITNAVFDPTLTRGFDYYTGMVFEVFDTNPENPRSLFGGGRYDGLVGMFGAESVPCVGFGMGDVTLLDFLETHGLLPEAHTAPELYLGTPDEGALAHALAYADTLRAQGLRVIVNLTSKPLGEQIKDAVRRGIPYFIAYGGSEESGSTVRVKTLAKSSEEEVPKDSVVEHIRR
jgi:histidyl-tRNA synthetase